ncbi:MAG: toxin-antitoxin system YwqK family antitoxin, partial [Fusobacterium sp.]
HVRNGKYIKYYSNGIINAVGNFKDGKLAGDWSIFYENGKLLGNAYFINGEISQEAS